MLRFSLLGVLLLAAVGVAAPVPKGADSGAWPMFGGSPGRNMANTADRGVTDRFTRTDAAWVAEIGTRCGTQPVIANGVVLVGTNNDRPRNAKDFRPGAGGVPVAIDRPVLMCFRASDGKFLWQARHDRPAAVLLGMSAHASTPCVDGDRAYYVTQRGEVVCADLKGFADGNQGIQTEKYKDETDADIVWQFDLEKEFGVNPIVPRSAPLVVGDAVFVVTGHGTLGFAPVAKPEAPSFVAFDKTTGKVLWKDASPGKNVMHGQWGSPSFAALPVPQVIFPGGDGWLYAFDPPTGKLLWKFDCNRKDAVYELGGTGDRNYFLNAPVVVGTRLFVGTGQDPEHSTGIAHLWCVDLKKAVELGAKAKDRDVSLYLLLLNKKADGAEEYVPKPNPASALAWVYGGEENRKWAPRDYKFGRTVSTVAVVDDVVYAAELDGYLHCLNANTGEFYWQYNTVSTVYGSPYFADGKVYLGTDDGSLFVFKHSKQPKKFDSVEAAKNAPDIKSARAIQKTTRGEVEKEYLIAKIEFEQPVRVTPAVAGGVLYVATDEKLYAIKQK